MPWFAKLSQITGVLAITLLMEPMNAFSQTCCLATPEMKLACTNIVTPGGRGYWDDGRCTCVVPASPIVIDTIGEGMRLTSASNGVIFDIRGDGHPIQLAWTAADSKNTLLALDRNSDGKIGDGTELFGNYTDQPPSPNQNGFLALAEFDKPENGGNNDGFITAQDSVYSRLLLWIDANHNGVSEPYELHSLPELGIVSISLDYKPSGRRDVYGNIFRYRAKYHSIRLGDRWAFDVFFATLDRN